MKINIVVMKIIPWDLDYGDFFFFVVVVVVVERV